ncbi:MAG TPA: hypothetical protein VKF40_28325 [Burkholderiales bacterium]|nr:hypothetical protein [Burkholderiales bacterium]
MTCSNPIDFETLLAWWLDELQPAAQEALEEHVFACAHCARRLEEFAAIAGGVRDAVRAGALGVVVTAPFVDALKQAGLRVREYQLVPGSSVNCTIHADDDAVVGRMRAPLGGVRRLDALKQLEVGGVPGPEVRAEDVPFDPASGEVVFVPSAAWLKKMPTHTLRVRLVAVEAAGEAAVGEYIFAHTAL